MSSNNKTKQASILQTDKTREDIWQEVESSTDIVHEFETVAQAQNIIVEKEMQYVPYDTFIK